MPNEFRLRLLEKKHTASMLNNSVCLPGLFAERYLPFQDTAY